MNFNLHVMSMDMQIHLHGLYMAVYNLWTGTAWISEMDYWTHSFT